MYLYVHYIVRVRFLSRSSRQPPSIGHIRMSCRSCEVVENLTDDRGREFAERELSCIRTSAVSLLFVAGCKTDARLQRILSCLVQACKGPPKPSKTPRRIDLGEVSGDGSVNLRPRSDFFASLRRNHNPQCDTYINIPRCRAYPMSLV